MASGYRLLAHAGNFALVEHQDDGLVFSYNLSEAPTRGHIVNYTIADDPRYFLTSDGLDWKYHNKLFPNIPALVSWWTYDRFPSSSWHDIAAARDRLAFARLIQMRRG